MINVVVFDDWCADWQAIYTSSGSLMWEGHPREVNWPELINKCAGIKSVTIVDFVWKDCLTRNTMSSEMWAAYTAELKK